MRFNPACSISSIRSAVRTWLLVSTLLLLTACASLHVPPLGADMQVWDVAAKKTITLDLLAERSRAANLVLIGETHDNLVHHRVQHWLLNALSTSGRRPALVMEQFDFEQQDAIDNAMSAHTSRVDALQILKQEMAQGWDWTQYQPLIATAKDYDLPLKAANLSRTRLQQVSRRGFAALGVGEASRLALDVGWSDAQQSRLEQDILDGHCGMLPIKAAAAVADAQRARDAMMADALLNAGGTIAVGILGREHVRRDLAVPLYLAARAPDRSVMAIGMIDSDSSQSSRDEAVVNLKNRFDYLVFTRSVRRDQDPCDGLVMPAIPPSN